MYLDNTQLDKTMFHPEVFQAAKKNRPIQIQRIKINSILTMWLWELCWIYILKTPAGINYAREERLFIKFKKTIFKKIIPLTTKDKKKQKNKKSEIIV